MQAIIQQLSDLPTNSFVGWCIKQWINSGMSAEKIIAEIKSIAKDNPPMIENILGKDLFNQIQNIKVC